MAGGPVTVSIAYPVARGEESNFYAWAKLRLAESADEPGHLGGTVVIPGRPGPDWLIVHRFTDRRAADRWTTWFANSAGAVPAVNITWEEDDGRVEPRRKESRARPAPPSPRPNPPPRRPPPRPSPPPRRPPPEPSPPPPQPAPQPDPPPRRPSPPPKWKMAIVTLTAVFPPVLLFNVTLIPYLQDLSVVIRSVILCVGVTIITTWVMMPRLTRLLASWLNPLVGRHRRPRQDAR
jgi:antibiotic biosynthesis monooxygenase (ABM) superfamily enzyme